MTSSVRSPRPGARGAIRLTIVGLFGLFFAYAVWNALAYLVTSVQSATGVGLALTPTAWAVLLLAVVVPIVSFVVTALIGWRRPLWLLALCQVLGLAVTSVFWLDAQAYMMTAVVLG